MTILVTGSAGLLGTSVCQLLTANGEEVVGLTRKAQIGRTTRWRTLAFDLAHPTWLPDALPKRVDTIIHLAQSRKFREFPEGAEDVFGVNVHSTARLLNYAVKSGADRFVYVSSGGLYQPGDVPLTENSPLEPPRDLGFYLGSKAAAEILVQNYFSLLDVTILRPFFIYGPGQRRDMLIPRLFDTVRCRHSVSLDADNGLLINPIHVEDAAIAVSKAAASSHGAVINIAGPETLSIRDIAVAFGRYLDTSPIFEQTEQPGRALLGSIDLMSQVLHAPQRRLRDSIDDIANPGD